MLSALLLSLSLLGATPDAKPETPKEPVCLCPDSLEIGQQGRVFWRIQVEEIVDDTTMIARCRQHAKLRRINNMEMVVAIGICFPEPVHPRLWIVGYPTKDAIQKNGSLQLDNYSGEVLQKRVTKNDDGSETKLGCVRLSAPAEVLKSNKKKNFDGPNK